MKYHNENAIKYSYEYQNYIVLKHNYQYSTLQITF